MTTAPVDLFAVDLSPGFFEIFSLPKLSVACALISKFSDLRASWTAPMEEEVEEEQITRVSTARCA